MNQTNPNEFFIENSMALRVSHWFHPKTAPHHSKRARCCRKHSGVTMTENAFGVDQRWVLVTHFAKQNRIPFNSAGHVCLPPYKMKHALMSSSIPSIKFQWYLIYPSNSRQISFSWYQRAFIHNWTSDGDKTTSNHLPPNENVTGPLSSRTWSSLSFESCCGSLLLARNEQLRSFPQGIYDPSLTLSLKSRSAVCAWISPPTWWSRDVCHFSVQRPTTPAPGNWFIATAMTGMGTASMSYPCPTSNILFLTIWQNQSSKLDVTPLKKKTKPSF